MKKMSKKKPSKVNPLMKLIEELNSDKAVSTRMLLAIFSEALDELELRVSALKNDLGEYE